MTDIKVLSRDEVAFDGRRWPRKAVEHKALFCDKTPWRIGWREILRLMDAYEEPKESILKTNTSADHTEPAPKWQSGMWAEVTEGRQKGYRFKVCDVCGGEPFLRDETEIPNWWFNGTNCRPVPPPKEEKPSQEIAASVSYQGYGESTGANREGPSYQPLRDDQRMALGLEKPENPFTGPHWAALDLEIEQLKPSHALSLRPRYYELLRQRDLRDELKEIRKLLAGKSETP